MKFKIYNVDSKYLDRLKSVDYRVPQEHSRKGNKRPFTGILFTQDNFKYIIPLTSPKQKHLKMNDALDFIKLNDGYLGALNLNNMIPVCNGTYHMVRLEDEKNYQYRRLLENQRQWMNVKSHKDKIISDVHNL